LFSRLFFPIGAHARVHARVALYGATENFQLKRILAETNFSISATFLAETFYLREYRIQN
jgi:hypothetical protein